MIKAIFFDIDGTLVPFGHPCIPPEVSEAIAAIRRKGVKVFIATGRHISWIDNLGDTEFDGYVTVNGGQCLLGDKKTIIHQVTIPDSDLRKLIDFSESHPEIPFAALPANGDNFITGVNDRVNQVCQQLHAPYIPVKDIHRLEGNPTLQLLGFFTEDEEAKLDVFSDVLTGCQPMRWHPLFADIIPTGSNKASGIDHMLNHFGISIDETAAFGDGDNDIPMLSHVGLGIAMGNAADAVKKAADRQTGPCSADPSENGIISALSEICAVS